MRQVRFFYLIETGDNWPDSKGLPTEERRLTFAYTYNKETGFVQYGATVFRDCAPGHVFKKESHRNTALARLIKRPNSFRVEVGTSLSHVEEFIRGDMFYVGACSDTRLHNPRHLEVVNHGNGNVTYLVSEPPSEDSYPKTHILRSGTNE